MNFRSRYSSRPHVPDFLHLFLLSAIIGPLSLFVISCDNGAGPQQTDPYARWRSYGAHDYTIRQTRTCFCIDAGEVMEITVRADTITNILRVSDSTVLRKDLWPAYRTIESLFSIVFTTGPDSLVVSYDPAYGFPASLDQYPQLHPVDGGVLYETTMAHIP